LQFFFLSQSLVSFVIDQATALPLVAVEIIASPTRWMPAVPVMVAEEGRRTNLFFHQ
jgi:hypothetical protein